MSILIKDALLGKHETDIYIEGNLIASVGQRVDADKVIEARGKAVLPGLVNTHTHAAMTLMRGYADDLKLQEWLGEHIWPLEAKLTGDDVYWGTKLACLEMIKSGTTTFNDQYFSMTDAYRAADEMGLRAVLAYGFIDLFDGEKREKEIAATKEFVEWVQARNNPRITPAVGPHALYTVSGDGLRWCREYADERDILIHFHLAETKKEVDDCIEANGKPPVPHIEDSGLVCDRLVAAHCVWLEQNDIKTLADAGASASHNPISNMKLGIPRVLPYPEMKAAGLNVSLGTDGASSNNTLNLFESLKFAAIAQKMFHDDPTVLPAAEALRMATEAGAKALRINAGKVEEGRLADLILVDLKQPCLVPLHDITSQMVYAFTSAHVDTTICDGKVLMENGVVPGEEDILENAQRVAGELLSR